MASMRIPERYLPGFKRIATLDQEAMQSLLNAMSQVKLSLSRKDLSENISSLVKGIADTEIDEIMAAVTAMLELQEVTGATDEKLAQDLSEALKTNFHDLSSEQANQIESRLSEILSLQDGIGIVSKARHLYQDYEHLYVSGKIITDIRPVFKTDLDSNSSMEGILIVYSLKIQYVEEGANGKEFFVALDETDLQELSEQIERAKKERRAIKQFFDNQDINISSFKYVTLVLT